MSETCLTVVTGVCRGEDNSIITDGHAVALVSAAEYLERLSLRRLPRHGSWWVAASAVWLAGRWVLEVVVAMAEHDCFSIVDERNS